MHTYKHIVEITYTVPFINILETLCNWLIIFIALKFIMLICHNLFKYFIIKITSHFCFYI